MTLHRRRFIPVCDLSPFYTMRVPYVALAIKTNVNEMYMQRKIDSTYITLCLFFIRIKYFGDHNYSQMLCTFFPKMYLVCWY